MAPELCLLRNVACKLEKKDVMLVRVICKWTVVYKKTRGEYVYVEMVLADQEGVRIQATIKSEFVAEFDPKIKEHACMLWRSLRYYWGDCAEKAAREQMVKDKIVKCIKVVLQDFEKNRLSCTQWDYYWDQLTNSFEKSKEGPIVITLQMCRDKVYRDEVGLCNTFDVTKLLVNEAIHEIEDYLNKLFIDPESSPQRHSQLSSASLHSMLDGADSSGVIGGSKGWMLIWTSFPEGQKCFPLIGLLKIAVFLRCVELSAILKYLPTLILIWSYYS